MRSEDILLRINALPAQRVKLMEVCGTHTMSIARAGIKRLLPEGVETAIRPEDCDRAMIARRRAQLEGRAS